MALVPVEAILWRRLQQANFDTLAGQSRGQYDIRLGRDDDLEDFFEGIPHVSGTALGGYEVPVPIASFDGPDPVGATVLTVRYMGPKSERKDWYVRSQRPETAYPLWRLDRVNTSTTSENYVIIVRDITGCFHARWMGPNELASLPSPLLQAFRSKTLGVKFMASENTATDALQIAEKLKSDHNVLLYGPPGTGKSQLMWEVAKAFSAPPLQVDTADETTPLKGGTAPTPAIVRWLTFHQSYSYEDFVVGLRPDASSDKALSLKATPGVLLELAEHVRVTGRPAVLLIDEINRGNVSRIFGEFITLLEPDKRLSPSGQETDTTVALMLPHVDDSTVVIIDGEEHAVANPFTMPANLYVLASMNSIDRSVAPLDAALRRRFRIINLEPDLGALEAAYPENPATSTDEEIEALGRLRKLAADLLTHLNEAISAFRGPDYQLGQWYLADLVAKTTEADTASALVDIWNEKLQPHLEDVFHGRAEQLAALLGHDGPIELVDPPSEYESTGGRPFIRRRQLSSGETLSFLTSIISDGETTEPQAPGTIAPDL